MDGIKKALFALVAIALIIGSACSKMADNVSTPQVPTYTSSLTVEQLRASYSPKGKEEELKESWLNKRNDGVAKYDDITFEVVYLNPAGYTTVNENGIFYHHLRYGGIVTWENKIYPSEYYDKAYSMYYIGEEMEFKIIVTSQKKHKNLKVVAIQEYFNSEGEAGVELPGQNVMEWKIPELEPGEPVTLYGKYYIPLIDTESGLDQTHIKLYKYVKHNEYGQGNGDNRDDSHSGMTDEENDGDSGQGNNTLLVDIPQAAVWCPPPADLGPVIYIPEDNVN